MPDFRRELIDLGAQRANQLTAAENALAANDQTAYDTAMAEVTRLNNEMSRRQTLIDEQDRNFAPASGAERRDMVEDRVNALRNGGSVTFTTQEIRREIGNALLVGSGMVTEPVGGGSTIHDPVGVGYSSIIDQVRTIDLTGVATWQEPYAKSGLKAYGSDPKAIAGKLRTDSTPSLGVAEIRPYEVSVTSYVDRNVEKLTNAAYYDKVYGMAIIALRKEIVNLIINGDGSASPIFFGIKNAKNKEGEAIFASEPIAAIGVETLDDLYFAYGDDESVGDNARLLLSKRNLKALGALRSEADQKRLFEFTRAPGMGNTGTIKDGGTLIPYTLASAVGDNSLLYGDPMNYLLGLFGGYSIRVDESYKAGERLLTILGDAMVGGNLIVDKGFVNATIGG